MVTIRAQQSFFGPELLLKHALQLIGSRSAGLVYVCLLQEMFFVRDYKVVPDKAALKIRGGQKGLFENEVTMIFSACPSQ
jgi:hypothetical protein